MVLKGSNSSSPWWKSKYYFITYSLHLSKIKILLLFCSYYSICNSSLVPDLKPFCVAPWLIMLLHDLCVEHLCMKHLLPLTSSHTQWLGKFYVTFMYFTWTLHTSLYLDFWCVGGFFFENSNYLHTKTALLFNCHFNFFFMYISSTVMAILSLSSP